jgi:hypothetical protein
MPVTGGRSVCCLQATTTRKWDVIPGTSRRQSCLAGTHLPTYWHADPGFACLCVAVPTCGVAAANYLRNWVRLDAGTHRIHIVMCSLLAACCCPNACVCALRYATYSELCATRLWAAAYLTTCHTSTARMERMHGHAEWHVHTDMGRNGEPCWGWEMPQGRCSLHSLQTKEGMNGIPGRAGHMTAAWRFYGAPNFLRMSVALPLRFSLARMMSARLAPWRRRYTCTVGRTRRGHHQLVTCLPHRRLCRKTLVCMPACALGNDK